MQTTLLTVTEALQLAAIGPCLFFMLYLCVTARRPRLVIVPILYLLALACSFLSPILLAIDGPWIRPYQTAAIFGEQLIPESSFLLIAQLVTRTAPPMLYWLILALPFVGIGPVILFSHGTEEICLNQEICLATDNFLYLYKIFGAALVFLLLMAILGRKVPHMNRRQKNLRHTYWLVIAIVLFNLGILGVDLGLAGNALTLEKASFIKTLLGIVFIYLALTSLFRISPETFFRTRRILTAHDYALADKIRRLMRDEKLYLDPAFNRAQLAEKLRLSEQHLSRIINMELGKSFRTMLNTYRVEEAKNLLAKTRQPITKILFDAGFQSLSSFNRIFLEYTGHRPSEYRKIAE